jgi:L-ascorbate metabolism protein UlaG (beta-lactamase superfamily)
MNQRPQGLRANQRPQGLQAEKAITGFLQYKSAEGLASEMPVGDLKDLDFILLTHQHGDHLDLGLLRGLKDFPILWVIPDPILARVQVEVEIPADRLIVPEPLQPIEIGGLALLPSMGCTWDSNPGRSRSGVSRRWGI